MTYIYDESDGTVRASRLRRTEGQATLENKPPTPQKGPTVVQRRGWPQSYIIYTKKYNMKSTHVKYLIVYVQAISART